MLPCYLYRYKSIKLTLNSFKRIIPKSLGEHDKNAYAGEWHSPDFSLNITPQAAQFTIDGKTYTDTTPEYFYGQLATSPFLYLQDAQQEHRLYLILDEDSNHQQSLRGYHDYASVSYPLEITREESITPNKMRTLSQN